MPTAERRRVDWDLILPGEQPFAKLAAAPLEPSELSLLTAQVMARPAPETLDRLLRRAIEFSLTVIQLERSAIYFVDGTNDAMAGTFGTDAHGRIVDEHALSYAFGPMDREIFARASAGFPWSVYDNCPQIAQFENTTRVIGRGWVACTAIVGPRGPLGILFNDTALTHAPLDEAKQARAAILCSLLGRVLEPCRSFLIQSAVSAPAPPHPLVREATQRLGRDPTLACDALAKGLDVNARQLARTFKRETKTSIVDYRNELRLARFLERIDADAHNLLDAALDAGFGSYAQFHRVFRARFGRSPREYLVELKQTHELSAR